MEYFDFSWFPDTFLTDTSNMILKSNGECVLLYFNPVVVWNSTEFLQQNSIVPLDPSIIALTIDISFKENPYRFRHLQIADLYIES